MSTRRERREQPTKTAAQAAAVLRWLTVAVLGLLGVAYVAWLSGLEPWQDFARRIWGPLVWLIKNPPSEGLTPILAAVLVIVMFFEPLYEFITDLDEVLGAKRRQEPAADKVANPPEKNGGPVSGGS